jgi:hypothetical protein
MEPFRKKGFKSLLLKWNKKLEESGFQDIEIELNNGRALRQSCVGQYNRWNKFERDSRLEYFCVVGHLVHDTIFPNDLEKFIMLKHAEGETITEIFKAMQANGFRMYEKSGKSYRSLRRHIMYIIRQWQMKWGIKTWSLQELSLKKNIS